MKKKEEEEKRKTHLFQVLLRQIRVRLTQDLAHPHQAAPFGLSLISGVVEKLSSL
jgi:hypothetical protein